MSSELSVSTRLFTIKIVQCGRLGIQEICPNLFRNKEKKRDSGDDKQVLF